MLRATRQGKLLFFVTLATAVNIMGTRSVAAKPVERIVVNPPVLTDKSSHGGAELLALPGGAPTLNMNTTMICSLPIPMTRSIIPRQM